MTDRLPSWIAAAWVAFAFALPSSPAYAISFYFEMGAGVTYMLNGASLFGEDTPSPLGVSSALNFGVAANFVSDTSMIGFQAGAFHRMSSGTQGSRSYSLMASYPALRLVMQRLYLTLGVSPIVWRRSAETAGLDNFERVDGGIALLGELGYLHPITPEVAIGLVAAAETVRVGSDFSPRPAGQVCIAFQFYIGTNQAFKTSRRQYGEGGMGEYEGYRYPYGWPRQN